MNILFAASEAVPFCKTGGLADVVGSLPPALAAGGDNVAVILPLYGQIGEKWRCQMTFRKYIYVDLSWRHEYCGLFSLQYQGVTWYFVDNEHYFKRDKLYGEYDDGERFAFFSRAVVALLPHLDTMPDVIHCNDWQTALVSVYLRDDACRWDVLRRIKTVFTIHNIEYQGRMGADTVEDLLGLHHGWYDDGTLQMDGDVNVLKAALLCSDAVTTVSPTYARQLHDAAYAHGMEQIIHLIGDKLHGVLNGIDTQSYDPAQDGVIPERFSASDLGGKAACKAALQKELGLAVEPDTPLIGMISRLVGHKGLDLVCEALDGIMENGVQLVVLGQGDKRFEDFFRDAQRRYPGRLCAYIGYADALARRAYAGCDLFLMPSKSEPCGLSQMIAMRYGTVPIVRQTGGLNDTVHSCQLGQRGNGFVFAEYRAADMLSVVCQAVALYRYNPVGYAAVQGVGMRDDFTWNRSAEAYRRIYREL
ncbi:MAG: glycogen synthase GlgA [Clostridiales bacterium]|nr:glycogen synthase GlgA [Candidatus Cacconaster stercorequi]